jgi:hypothetical protein
MDSIRQSHLSSVRGTLSHHLIRIGHSVGLGFIQRFFTSKVFDALSIKKLEMTAGIETILGRKQFPMGFALTETVKPFRMHLPCLSQSNYVPQAQQTNS